MRSWIMNNFHVDSDKVKVLYDRPSDNFFIYSDEDRLSVYMNYLFCSICNLVYRKEFLFLKDLILKTINH